MSLSKYPQYKDSWVAWLGKTPEHWEVLSARRVFEERRDEAMSDDEQLSATQRYGVIPQRLFMEAEDQKVVLALSGTANFKHVQANDFVISLRSFQGGIEHSNYDGCVSPAYTVLRSRFQIEPRYWAHALKCSSYISALQTVTAGIRDGKNISYAQFGGLEVPVPPLAEQVAIASFLDRETVKIDALIAEQEKLLALLAEKRQATISHAVTRGLDPNVPMKDSGIPWLGEVPAHWNVGGLTRFIGPVVDYRGRTPTKGDDGMFLVTAKNVRDGVIDYEVAQEYVDPQEAEELLARGAPEIGDVLFTMEAPLGQVAQVDRTDIALAQRLVKFRGTPDVMGNRFLMFWLMSSGCQARMEMLATGSTALGIKASKLGMIECLAPPIEEQWAIVEYIDTTIAKNDALETQALRGIDVLKERRSALISAAVTGKIDVRGVVEAQAA